MTSTIETPTETGPSLEAVRIGLVAVTRNRRRRLHLYGHFLDLGWHVVRPGTVRATLPVTRRLWGESGGLAVTPIATLAALPAATAAECKALNKARFECSASRPPLSKTALPLFKQSEAICAKASGRDSKTTPTTPIGQLTR